MRATKVFPLYQPSLERGRLLPYGLPSTPLLSALLFLDWQEDCDLYVLLQVTGAAPSSFNKECHELSGTWGKKLASLLWVHLQEQAGLCHARRADPLKVFFFFFLSPWKQAKLLSSESHWCLWLWPSVVSPLWLWPMISSEATSALDAKKWQVVKAPCVCCPEMVMTSCPVSLYCQVARGWATGISEEQQGLGSHWRQQLNNVFHSPLKHSFLLVHKF